MSIGAFKKRSSFVVLLVGALALLRGISACAQSEAPEQPARDFSYRAIRQENRDYDCLIVNPRSREVTIEFLWKHPDGREFGSFERVLEFLSGQKKKPVMLMNAGIFATGYVPLGLLYANGVELQSVNTEKGTGNFFLEPNGVFILEKSDSAHILTTRAFLDHRGDIRHATQSGPMLVIDSAIHPAFNPQSQNRNIRNGVGVQPDGNIVFVISRQPVTLHEFARVFRDGFGCKNALYLDGAISQMYLPDYGRQELDGWFAGIIAVVKKDE